MFIAYQIDDTDKALLCKETVGKLWTMLVLYDTLGNRGYRNQKMENKNQTPKAQLIERLKEANNVLVTVSRNPSVDQLSAAIGLTLMLNHLDKHATAVFSGETPNTLEFLKPEETIEKTTDSLRDFIISLDKTKADKLRYKVEDTMVKIFITPYRTSLSDKDLIFGQGDFNVDVVVAIGAQQKEDLDEAITSHGRILHDATVATVNTTISGQLGSINWVDAKASSLCEMLVPICDGLKPNTMDPQMATAFLTGIVAETQRFSNEKTSSDTMAVSAKLMAAGANQQLVATQLEKVAEPANEPEASPEIADAEHAVEDALDKDGSLDISHEAEAEETSNDNSDLPDILPDHQAEPEAAEEAPTEQYDRPPRLMLEPPTLGSRLTANTEPEALDPSTDPMTVRPVDQPLLSHNRETTEPEPQPEKEEEPVLQESAPQEQPELVLPEVEEKVEEIPELPIAPVLDTPEPEAPASTAVAVDEQTLTDLEVTMGSPHVADTMIEQHQSVPEQVVPNADAALAAAHDALTAASSGATEKPAAFNAGGFMDVGHEEESNFEPQPAAEPQLEQEPEPEPEQTAPISIDPTTGAMSYAADSAPFSADLPAAPGVADPNAPPPVPPPMPMPPLMPTHEPPANNVFDPNNLPPVPQ